MDWAVYIPGLLALGGAFTGALVGALGMWFAQRAAQRGENVRHTRKIAYEAAVSEWTLLCREKIGGAGKDRAWVPAFGDFLIYHLSLAEALGRLDVTLATGDEIITILKRLDSRHRDVTAYRERETVERMQQASKRLKENHSSIPAP